LNRARDDQSQLRVPMAMEDMGHVKHRRPSLQSGVEHLEERLEVTGFLFPFAWFCAWRRGGLGSYHAPMIPKSLQLGLIIMSAAFAGRAELFVSDYSNNVVRRFNETNGAFIDVFVANTNHLLSWPHGLAFGPDGNLYVASAGNSYVLRYNGTNGSFMDIFVNPSTGLDYPVRLIFRPDGMLYASSQAKGRVLRFNATNGNFVDVFVTNSPALSGPSDMTFGPDGNLYVVDRYGNRVVRYNGTNGAFMDSFGTNNLSQPFGLRFTPTHDLLVVSGNGNSVQRFDGRTGAFLGTFASDGGLSIPIGINYGPDGNLYVASYGAHKVIRYDSLTGAYLGDFVTDGSGGLSGPNFMTFRPPVAQPSTVNLSVTNSTAAISWPARSVPAVPERTATLAPSSWQWVTNAVTTNATENVVTVPVDPDASFFRLRELE